ncbi:MAG: hypothetical protein M9947_01985 [Thermomicrobiales bacterium]|nr:hypothetical protein [Thermomicrobiales bacterium]
MAKRRLAVVGLDHYHTTGWVESIELFPDELEIVGIYEPDRTVWSGLAPRYYDPHLKPSLHERHRATPFFDDLGKLIETASRPISLVTLQIEIYRAHDRAYGPTPESTCWSTNQAPPTGQPPPSAPLPWRMQTM